MTHALCYSNNVADKLLVLPTAKSRDHRLSARAAPGDVIYWKETYYPYPSHSGPASYRATWDDDDPDGGWKPSIFMPKALARIRRTCTEVLVQRVQDMTEEDAIAEGFSCLNSYRMLFNGKESFDSNPFVFVYKWKNP
jgi:hypothetical protein